MHFNDYRSNYRFLCELMPPENSRLAKMRREQERRERERWRAKAAAIWGTRIPWRAPDEHAPNGTGRIVPRDDTRGA